MDAIQAITTRRSVRKYKKEAVRPEDLAAILDCGRLAPSAVNRQSWRIVAVTEEALKAKVAACTQYGRFIADAGAAVCVFAGADCVGPHEDSGAATENMIIAAHALGYATCWIGTHDNPAYLEIAGLLGAPEGWRMMTLFALGVPDGAPSAPAKKSFDEVCSYNGF